MARIYIYEVMYTKNTMGFEQVQHETTGDNNLETIGSNAVQIAIARKWAESENVPYKNNELMQAWIENGLAKEYRSYVETHPEEVVDVGNPQALQAMLERICGTVH
jgi:hypothetical protein